MTISSAASAINLPPDIGEARRHDTEQIKELLDRCLRERQFKEKHNRVDKTRIRTEISQVPSGRIVEALSWNRPRANCAESSGTESAHIRRKVGGAWAVD